MEVKEGAGASQRIEVAEGDPSSDTVPYRLSCVSLSASDLLLRSAFVSLKASTPLFAFLSFVPSQPLSLSLVVHSLLCVWKMRKENVKTFIPSFSDRTGQICTF